MTYRVALNHNNVAGLADMNPQPAAPEGVRYPELLYSGNGHAIVNGFRQIKLVWSAITISQYNNILSQFDLSETTRSRNVTVRIRRNDGAFTNANAVAILPDEATREYALWKNLVILLNKVSYI